MAKISAIVLLTWLMAGCADLSYYLHSVKGQLSIMQQSRDIEVVLKDASTEPRLAERLELIKQIREFARIELGLPATDSYTRYADLGRPYVVKNLFAAEEFSIELDRWCYPVVGCAGYRGYFDEHRLERYRSRLLEQGKDVHVANIPAYSTLGWFDDPVLNTFVYWPDERLAGLIFHELAHRLLYVDDDTRFNESFAMAVQQTGTELWLQHHAQAERLESYQQRRKNRQQVIALIGRARDQLRELYAQALSEQQKRQQKQQTLQRLRQDYERLSTGFDQPEGFRYWFQGELNNAKLASLSTYHSQVESFRNLLLSHAGDYAAFYRHVERLAGLEKERRDACMEYWQSPGLASDGC